MSKNNGVAMLEKRNVTLRLRSDLVEALRIHGYSLSQIVNLLLEDFIREKGISQAIRPERDKNEENKSPGRDLNPRPLAYQASALPC